MYYESLLSSVDLLPSAELLCEGSLFLLKTCDYSRSLYELLDKCCAAVLDSKEVVDDEKNHLLENFISSSLKWLKVCDVVGIVLTLSSFSSSLYLSFIS